MKINRAIGINYRRMYAQKYDPRRGIRASVSRYYSVGPVRDLALAYLRSGANGRPAQKQLFKRSNRRGALHKLHANLPWFSPGNSAGPTERIGCYDKGKFVRNANGAIYLQHGARRRKIPNDSRYGGTGTALNLPQLERPMTRGRELKQYHERPIALPRASMYTVRSFMPVRRFAQNLIRANLELRQCTDRSKPWHRF